MKKWKIISIVVLLIILVISWINWDKIILKTNIRINCWDAYKNEFWLNDVNIDNEDESIRITFITDSFTESHIEIVKFLYDEIFKIVYIDKNGKYYSYSLEIIIDDVSQYTYVSISNITNDSSSIKIVGHLKISEIVKICPKVASIIVYDMEYESIEIFKEFNNLQKIYCIDEAIDDYEKDYISSLFPECQFN